MLFRQSFLSHHIIRRAIMTSSYTPIAIQHVNLAIPKGTLEQAQEFYGDVIGFKNDQVPQLQRGTILWYAAVFSCLISIPLGLAFLTDLRSGLELVMGLNRYAFILQLQLQNSAHL